MDVTQVKQKILNWMVADRHI